MGKKTYRIPPWLPNRDVTDLTDLEIMFQGRVVDTAMVAFTERVFRVIWGWIGNQGNDFRIPPRPMVNGRLEPRRWNLRLELQDPVDKEVLARISLPEDDPEVRILEETPRAGENTDPVNELVKLGVASSEDEDSIPITILPREGAMTQRWKPERTNMEEQEGSGQDQEPRQESQERTEGKAGKGSALNRVSRPAHYRVKIAIVQEKLMAAQAHADTSELELGGMLIGEYLELKDSNGKFVVEIWDTFPAKQLISRGASVTFTVDTWAEAIREKEERYGESMSIVGWYHTHPGFGIFLSGYDMFIHENFFNEPWQVALVIDPHSKEYGFFAWDEAGKVSRFPNEKVTLLYDGDEGGAKAETAVSDVESESSDIAAESASEPESPAEAEEQGVNEANHQAKSGGQSEEPDMGKRNESRIANVEGNEEKKV